MKRIGIFLNVQKSPHTFDGGREYTIAIIDKIYKRLGQKDKLFIFSSVSYSAISDTSLFIEFQKSKNCSIVDIRYIKVDQLVETINNCKLTVAFDPEGYNSNKLPLDKIACRKIITLHGFRQIDVPVDKTEYYLGNKLKYFLKVISLRAYTNRQINKIKNIVDNLDDKDIILTSSKHSKYVLKTLPIITKAQIKSVYLPIKIGDYDISGKQFNTPNEFILLLNADRWIKNAYRVLQAYMNLLHQNKVQYHIVVAGSNKYLRRIFKHPKIYHINYIAGNELEILFKKCKFLIYPSLSEGFGYPPLELLKYNKPSLLSFATSIYEITQGQFIYFNPYSVSEIKARILEAIESYQEKEYWNEICSNTLKIIQHKQQKDVEKTIRMIYE